MNEAAVVANIFTPRRLFRGPMRFWCSRLLLFSISDQFGASESVQRSLAMAALRSDFPHLDLPNMLGCNILIT